MSEDAMSASCEGYEHRVVLSTVGFSRGIHYWELTIDRYHSDTDPAFGIARADVSRDQMLGEFEYLIRMYISSLTKTSIYNNFPSFHNYRQRRQGLEHVHRPSALLVHARRCSRSAHRGWHPTGLDGRSPPRPRVHSHVALLRRRSSPGRYRFPRPLRSLLSGCQSKPRRLRHSTHSS